jgi:hypothetical protein
MSSRAEADMTNRRSTVIIAGIGAALALLSACAPQVTVTPLGAERVYPATPDSVQISLYTVTKPECPFEEIAAITAERKYTDRRTPTYSRRSGRKRARSALTRSSGTCRVPVAATASGAGADIPVRSGTAIRFRSADCMK